MTAEPAPSPRRRARIREVARETLGYDRLRPGQAEAIDAVLLGRDTLVVLATGQGKSAIYQLAGAQLEGPTIVVSPLLALQRDQVQAIDDEELIGDAAALNSTASEGDREEIFRALDAGALEFLFLAPEQFVHKELLERLAASEPSLFVVDEAHCICDWGHDFRPAYLRLKPVIEALGGPIVLAMTATAAPPIRDEIIERLGMDKPAVIVRGFDRPNIRLDVRPVTHAAEKRDAVFDEVRRREGPGLVYVATRGTAERLATRLREGGVNAAAYHAGLSRSRRTDAEAAFKEGTVAVIVATVAFGMGIDKPDIRYVIHHDISGSLDAYYQEIGRAGRDGLPSDAVLFYRAEDLGLRRYFGGVPQLDSEELQQVLGALDGGAEDAVVAAAGVSPARVRAALDLFTRAGVAEFGTAGEIRPVANLRRKEAIEAALEVQRQRTRFEGSRIEMVRSYAETRGCRRQFLLSYFGDSADDACGNCDNCETTDGEALNSDTADSPFAPGDAVTHETFGAGRVLRYAEDRLTVLFDEAGYRILDLHMVTEGQLLKAP